MLPLLMYFLGLLVFSGLALMGYIRDFSLVPILLMCGLAAICGISILLTIREDRRLVFDAQSRSISLLGKSWGKDEDLSFNLAGDLQIMRFLSKETNMRTLNRVLELSTEGNPALRCALGFNSLGRLKKGDQPLVRLGEDLEAFSNGHLRLVERHSD